MMNYLVVHCSESPDGRDDRAADIHRWHQRRSPPFDGIGYHAVICRSGEIEQGRPHYWQGAHVRGHNKKSLGVCLIGTSDFTDAQMRSLAGLLKAWSARYPYAEIVGHTDLDNSKTCPNFDVAEFWANADKWG